MSKTFTGIVMDGSLRGQRLAHHSGRYVREHFDGLGQVVTGLQHDAPFPSRWQETYVFLDGSDKVHLPGWYLQ